MNHALYTARILIVALILPLVLAGIALAVGFTIASHLPGSKLLATTPPSASAAASFAAIEASKPRTVVLHGRVLNEWGQALAGATVQQVGTAYCTRTDASGSYSLRVPAGTPATLQCSYDGHAKQEVSAASPVSVALQASGR